MRILRLSLLAAALASMPGCGLVSALFGGSSDAYESPYLAAMTDFSLCETAPSMGERRAAAARLAQTAAQMQAETDPPNADFFYELDRIVAANARCQSVLGQ